jgi:hypothetical protein
MDMNAAGALHAYARQSAQTLGGSQAQGRRPVVPQPVDPRSSLPPAVAPAKQPPLTSGLDLLA